MNMKWDLHPPIVYTPKIKSVFKYTLYVNSSWCAYTFPVFTVTI